MVEGDPRQILTWGSYCYFPHGMFVAVGDTVVGLECPFDDTLDDYLNYFDVTLVPGVKPRALVMGVFYHRPYEEIHVGRIRVEDVMFDGSRRKSIKSPALEAVVQAALDKR